MQMVHYSLTDFQEDCARLAVKIQQSGKQYSGIYPVLRGGVPIALQLTKHLPTLKILKIPDYQCLVVDDIIDGGRTIAPYQKDNIDTAVLHIKKGLPAEMMPTFFAQTTDKWIHYWWEGEKKETSIEDNITRVLQYIGEDITRVGLIDTPKRVAKMYTEFYAGYDKSRMPKLTVFPNGQDGVHYDQMLKDEGYFFSCCEHHMMPFFGSYYFGYIPDKLILGASKIGKVVDYYAGRLQIAERLVHDVVNCIEEACHPHGMILVMKARHLCKEMRGLKKWDSPYEAIAVRGYFAENKNGCKDEFMERLPR
jgi:GTP cyclohydrolase IA